jgi:hypothetical protein
MIPVGVLTFWGGNLYRTIDSELWIDRKVRCLDTETKLLFVYLITNSHTHLSGIYYLPKPFITHETGVALKGLDRGLEALDKADMVKYDNDNELVFVINMLKRQKGLSAENKNVWKSISSQLKSFENSYLVSLFVERYGSDNLILSSPLQAPSKGVGEGLVIDIDIDTVKAPVKVKAPVTEKLEIFPSRFEEFWKAYPIRSGSKGSKPDANRSWIKFGCDAIYDTVIASLEAYKRCDQWSNPKYIPMVTSWLNGQAWESTPVSSGSSSIKKPSDRHGIDSDNRTDTTDFFAEAEKEMEEILRNKH